MRQYKQFLSEPHNHVRLLVCGESGVLAWLAGLTGDECTVQQAQFLSSIAASLAARLQLEKEARIHHIAAVSLPHVLNEISQPAYLLTLTRRIIFANDAGKSLLKERGRHLLDTIPVGDDGIQDARWRVTIMRERGMAPCVLAILRSANRRQQRLLRVAGAWGLTEQERRVLGLAVDGPSDQEIADQLGLAKKTVEEHLRNIRSKANKRGAAAGSIKQLIARFWTWDSMN